MPIIDTTAPWERWPSEPNKWFDRFTLHYLPQGSSRTLAEAQRSWHRAEILEGRLAPDSKPPQAAAWHTNAARWQWQARAEAWDHQQRLIKLAKAEADREANRRQRIATLNELLTKAGEAVLTLDPNEARWSDVTQAIKVAVQELGSEYGRAQAVDLEVNQGPKVPTGAATALGALAEDDLEALILSLTGHAAAQAALNRGQDEAEDDRAD